MRVQKKFQLRILNSHQMLQAPVKNPSKLCLLFVMSKKRNCYVYIFKILLNFIKVILEETVEAVSLAK